MDGQTWQSEQFERQRPRLQAVAYRMLGSVTDAEDAVQEAWLRLTRSETEAIDNLGGWLTTVLGRVCIDMLRARQSRREAPIDDWLPEPLVAGDSPDPADELLLADSVGLALLVVLETLSPPERLAFVLHDTFGVPFSEIAPIVQRTPEATRQLASRARRRIRGATPEPDADLSRQRRVVAAFLAAARAGDFEALLEVLDPDVVFRAYAGGIPGLVPPRVAGAERVARFTTLQGPIFAHRCHPATVNGAAGLVILEGDRRLGAVAFTVTGERIVTVDLVLDADEVSAAGLAG
ncbi:MAG TPA: RNA polymerase sigma factor SigJ [Solirubrobacteraceae bacterium]|jgi:RNA polymerase sigma-70 factor (ECF subfamily)|nr:RNA polymerase sigma factor SigJ [Solirubrobacteraceae bacterium]